MIASLLGIFMLVNQQPSGVMAFSLDMFNMLGVALCWRFTASTECEMGLIYHLAVEWRCDDIWQSCRGSHDKILQAFSSPSVFAYGKQSKTGGVEGLGTSLEEVVAGSCSSHINSASHPHHEIVITMWQSFCWTTLRMLPMFFNYQFFNFLPITLALCSIPLYSNQCTHRQAVCVLLVASLPGLSSSCCSEPQCGNVQLSPFYHLSTLDVTHMRKIPPGPPRSSCNRKHHGPANEATLLDVVTTHTCNYVTTHNVNY